MGDILQKTLVRPSYGRFAERGSRFYAFAFPVSDARSIDARRAEIAEKFPDATHHCYAWRIDPSQPKEFAQDDGEPSGSAGLPILGVIRSASLVNVLIIVVRYFGGTKLGKSGLIQSYREAAALSIASTEIKNLDRFTRISITYPYEQENQIRELVNRFHLEIEQEEYLEKVTIDVFCKAEPAPELQRILQHLSYLGITCKSGPDCYRPVIND